MHKSYYWVEWYILTHHNGDQNLRYLKWSNINWNMPYCLSIGTNDQIGTRFL